MKKQTNRLHPEVRRVRGDHEDTIDSSARAGAASCGRLRDASESPGCDLRSYRAGLRKLTFGMIIINKS